jgi:hypothetical protein
MSSVYLGAIPGWTMMFCVPMGEGNDVHNGDFGGSRE